MIAFYRPWRGAELWWNRCHDLIGATVRHDAIGSVKDRGQG